MAVSWVAFGLAEAIVEWDATDYSSGIKSTTTILEAATLVLFAGILGPAAEELMYRGVLFRWMRQRVSFWAAALVSSAIFGLVHQYWDAIINAAIVGVFFAWLFERSRSLVVPIVAHQTWNTVSVTLTWIGHAL